MTGEYASNPHAEAFLLLLRQAWDLVGDSIAPEGIEVDDQKRLVRPYAVLYPQGSGAFDGSISDPDTDAWPVVQVTYVGRDRAQADALRDRCRVDVIGALLAVDGRQVGPVRIDHELPTRRDDDVTPHVFYAVDLYRTFSTPTS